MRPLRRSDSGRVQDDGSYYMTSSEQGPVTLAGKGVSQCLATGMEYRQSGNQEEDLPGWRQSGAKAKPEHLSLRSEDGTIVFLMPPATLKSD